MTRTIKLSRVESVLSALEYPISRTEAANGCDDVTVLLADGEMNLGATIEELGSDRFETEEDLEMEVFSQLPVGAVGEPGQSEGDA
ncbi:hypothetical protein [Halomarina litorea]|uniref:DUF5789 family protein n=1 Tax=Halomarina litorea TaxID=2961595 RepID=UPI0020C1CFCB|nr:hypothetical protein [Halomarina sp. BCD28]